MDPLSVVGLTRALVDIDSTTGREGEVCAWLAGYLRGRGWQVREQPVEGARVNLVATTVAGRIPAVVLSTHTDCVPPFFPSRIEGSRLHGRGACDAKGILAAQVTAAERLVAAGNEDVGLLFVVGEERGSDGAIVANRTPIGSRYLVNGEPTDNRLGSSTRGVLRLKLNARGRAAHSSYPELGVSAIDKLLDALIALRTIPLPETAAQGRTHYTIGVIDGGVAPNVVSPHASAEILFRTIGNADDVRALLDPVKPYVEVEEVLEVPPAMLRTLDGFEAVSFPYTTDIPLLAAWGEPLLFGPGSIHLAHTAEEYVEIGDLEAAVDAYERIVAALATSSAS